MTPADPRAAAGAGVAWLGGPAPLDGGRHGLKASWLDRALRAGARVPAAFVVDVDAAQRLCAGDAEAYRALERALASLCADGSPARLAVRASAALSLPGALLTRLDVAADPASVLAALREVVASAQAPAVHEQLRARQQTAPAEPWVAVIVQHYMPTRAAGELGAVAFTHDPRSGRRALRGEYAAGGTPDVVSGRMRPDPLESGHSPRALALRDARAFAEIEALAERLEAHFGEPLELELAWLTDRLWLLQARALALSARALVQLALAAIDADSPSYARWLEALAGRGLDTLVEQHFAAELARDAALLRGLAASPGVASGVLVTDVARAVERAAHEPVVLMRNEAVPEDVRGFRAAQAVVTSSGGLTCHAAVIARGLGIPAVVGCADARVDPARGQVFAARGGGAPLLAEGDWISVDARAGLVYRGVLPRQTRIADPELKRLFVQVRQLRPAPLWAWGEAELALRTKDDACLDGALCPLPAGTSLPPPRGRECWLELDADELDARFSSLPAGWGVVVRGDLTRVSIPALRKSAPLRALGIRLDDPAGFMPAGRLDVVVVGTGERAGAAGALEPGGAAGAGTGEPAASADEAGARALLARVDAARVLFLVNFFEPARVGPRSALCLATMSIRDNVGWVYPASQAARGALSDAALRARQVPQKQAR